MRRALFVLIAAVIGLAATPGLAKSRIKDIVEFEGNRTNSLVGMGFVVGLNGTGDNMRNSPQTLQIAQATFERLGTNVRDANLNSKNIASVMVTANLPSNAAAGSQMDFTLTGLHALHILGGTLVITPLIGADGNAYASAQGTIQTGSVSASGASGSSVTKGVPTAGRIASGAIIEREVPFVMADMQNQRLTLRNPDFTTASRVAAVINEHFPGAAVAENATIVALSPPRGVKINDFDTAIENYEVEPDNPAKIVIDEVNGTITVGAAVRVSRVSIMQGNLTISVQETPAVSQPLPRSGGATTVTPQSAVSVNEETGRQFVTIDGGTSAADLVAGLNALGVTPRDMMAILQNLKAQGAIQAEVEVL